MSEQEIHVNSGNVDPSKVRVLIETDQSIDQSELDHVEREVNRWLAGGRTSLVSVNCKVRVFGLPESRYVYERTAGAVTERFEAPSLSELQALVAGRDASTTPIYTTPTMGSPPASTEDIRQEMQKYQEGLQRFLMWPSGTKTETTTTSSPTGSGIPPFRIEVGPQKYIDQMAEAQREIHKALDEREPTMRSAKWQTRQPKQLKPADGVVVSEMKNSKGEPFDPQPAVNDQSVIEPPVADAIKINTMKDREPTEHRTVGITPSSGGWSIPEIYEGTKITEITTLAYSAHGLRVFQVWSMYPLTNKYPIHGLPSKGDRHPDKPGKRCVSLECDRRPDVEETNGLSLWLITAHYQ